LFLCYCLGGEGSFIEGCVRVFIWEFWGWYFIDSFFAKIY